MLPKNRPGKSTREKILSISSERILILDGAMGTLIQAHRTPSGNSLEENDFRGDRFQNHLSPLKGCNEILCLTMPDLISEIHEKYLEAGADIIETCSFSGNAISLADHGLEDYAYEINFAAATLAKKAADKFSANDKPRFVAGSIGPTSKSASISGGTNWDELEAVYYDNVRGLFDGGADIIIIETCFDTLNAKAAIFAVQRFADEHDWDIPVIVSATIVEKGGRLLSGQTVQAFLASVLHANPLSVGINCSFGAEKMKPYIAEISAAAPCLVSACPNAGLPNNDGFYDQNPETMASCTEEYLREGIVNILGGCCGSTPAHISAIAALAKDYKPRLLPEISKKIILAGLEVPEFCREGFAEKHIAAKCSAGKGYSEENFADLINKGEYDDAADILAENAEDGSGLINICLHGAALTPEVVTNFLNCAFQFPNISRLPVMISSSSWELTEASLKCLAGKGIVNISGNSGLNVCLKEDTAEFIRRMRLVRAYGAAAAVNRSMKDIVMKANFPLEDIVLV